MGTIQPAEIIVILLLALLLFGPKKLPEIGKTVGSAVRELRKAAREFSSTIEDMNIIEKEDFNIIQDDDFNITQDDDDNDDSERG